MTNPVRRALYAVILLCISSIIAQEKLSIQRIDVGKETYTVTDKIQFLDDLTGWATGGTEDEIFKTDDGGKTWKIIKPVIKNLDDVAINTAWFVTKNKGFATIVHTVPNLDDHLSINIYIPAIISTEDGGNSWKEVGGFTPEESYPGFSNNYLLFTDMYFYDELHGWALSMRKSIYVTKDGGKSWMRKYVGEYKNYFYKVRFSDPEHGWITVGYDGILHTDNGGESWVVQKATTNDVEYEGEFRDIFTIDNNNVWALSQRIYKTTDGGKNWNRIIPKGYEDEDWWTSVKFIDAKRGWIGSLHNVLLYTKDGGLTWKNQFPEKGVSRDVGISAIAIAGNKLFLSGNRYDILKEGWLVPGTFGVD